MRSVILIFCVGVFMASSQAEAGAWTQKKKKGQAITTATAYRAPRYFDATGNTRRQSAYYKQETSAYGEYGLTDDITIGGQASLIYAYQEVGAAVASASNAGDTTVFARKRLWQDATSVISVQPSVIFPSLDNKNTIPKIGSDHMAFGLRTGYGRNFQLLGNHHYADVEAEYRYRAGTAANQLRLEATAGLNINNTWQIIPQAFITKSTTRVRNTAFTQSSADNYDQITLQLSAQYTISEKNALQAGIQHNIYGKNTGAGQGVLLGYLWNF